MLVFGWNWSDGTLYLSARLLLKVSDGLQLLCFLTYFCRYFTLILLGPRVVHSITGYLFDHFMFCSYMFSGYCSLHFQRHNRQSVSHAGKGVSPTPENKGLLYMYIPSHCTYLDCCDLCPLMMLTSTNWRLVSAVWRVLILQKTYWFYAGIYGMEQEC